MKRKFSTLGTVLVAGTLFAAMTLTASAAQITEETAKSTALASVGLSADSVSFTKAELDRDDGRLIYEIEFLTSDFKEYNFDIDAESGSILDMEYEWKTAPVSGNGAQAAITLEDAKALAITHTGLQASQVTLKKAELDYDDGRLIYDIEFYTSDLKELDYEIDAVTGTIIQWGFDLKNYVPPVAAEKPSTPAVSPGTGSSTKPSSGLSLEAAKAKALGMAGLSSADVRWKKAKLDHDDGRQIYELEFYHGNMEYEIELDAATGAVLDFDAEEDD